MRRLVMVLFYIAVLSVTAAQAAVNSAGWNLLGPYGDGRVLSVMNGVTAGIQGMGGTTSEQFIEPTLHIENGKFRVWFTEDKVESGKPVVFPGYPFTRFDLYYIESTDGGTTWTAPQLVLANHGRSYVYKKDGIYYLFAVHVTTDWNSVDVYTSTTGNPGTFTLLAADVFVHSTSGPDSGPGGIGNLVATYENNTWYLFYEAMTLGYGWKIFLATGSSLTSLSKTGTALIDRGLTTSPGHLVKSGNTYYLIGHFGVNTTTATPAQIGHLSATSLTGPWTWQGWDIFYFPEMGGDLSAVADPTVAYNSQDGHWYAFYELSPSEWTHNYFCLARFEGTTGPFAPVPVAATRLSMKRGTSRIQITRAGQRVIVKR